MKLFRLFSATFAIMVLALAATLSYALPVIDIAAEDLLRQAAELKKTLNCWHRLNIDPPCRLNIDLGRVAIS